MAHRRRPLLNGLALIACALFLTACDGSIQQAELPEALTASATHALTPIEQLGSSIFFDETLSINGNQSCASCHDPEVGWTGPIDAINAAGAVYEGSIPGRFGNRNPPSAAYATDSPILHYVIEKKEPLFIGGNFWDGRATGERLGNPAADQALGPFLNPVEQALPDAACVVYRVCNPVIASDYPVGLPEVWGPDSCAISWPADVNAVCATEGGTVSLSAGDRARVDQAYDQIGLTIAAFEASPAVNAFTSKYDFYLAGMTDLTKLERRGLQLFRSKGKCSGCHLLEEDDGSPPLLTDFTFDNLGIPRNPDNPFYPQLVFNPDGADWVDPGLGGFLGSRADYADFAAETLGAQRVPTLRNVALGSCEAEPDNPDCIVKAYGHNGYFKSLAGIVHFYNTRDLKPTCPDPFTREADALALGCWPEPEISANVNTRELGSLHLTEAQEAALVAFLLTLSDGYVP